MGLTVSETMWVSLAALKQLQPEAAPALLQTLPEHEQRTKERERLNQEWKKSRQKKVPRVYVRLRCKCGLTLVRSMTIGSAKSSIVSDGAKVEGMTQDPRYALGWRPTKRSQP